MLPLVSFAGARRLLLLSTSIAIAGGSAAFAQTSSTASQADRTEGEIVVTASRSGEQSIQKTPLAISAVSGEDLATRGVGGLTDLSHTVPSLNVTEQQPGTNKIDMRGVTAGALDTSDAQDRSLVAIYLDDTPLSLQGNSPDLKVLDLERVEVIRGPQGTLFGAGSMSGTIRYITAKPDASKTFGSFDILGSGTKGGGFNYNARAMFNLPLADTLALRVSGYQGTNSGYIRNVRTNKNNTNEDKTTQFRAALRFTPNEKLTVDASVTFADLDVNERNATYSGLGEFEYASFFPELYRDRTRIYNLTLDYKTGDFDLISSTSYIDRFSTSTRSFDFLTSTLLGTPLAPSKSFIDNDVTDFTQENRINFNNGGPLKVSAGIFYERLKRHYFQDSPSPGFDANFSAVIGAPFSSLDYLALTTDDIFTADQFIKERQFAVFGEATYTLADGLDLTAGVRYFNWKQDFDLSFRGVAGALGVGRPLTVLDTAKENGFNPRFNASYKISDNHMIFAEAAKGFRYGGVNQPAPDLYCGAALAAQGLTSSPATFGADSLWNYSVGTKNSFLDRRLTFNATGFYIDWSDVQTRNNLSCGYYFIQNAGKLRSKGVELESSFRLTPNWTVSGNYSFTDATANGPIPNAGARDGDRAPFFPRHILNVATDLKLPVGEDNLIAHVDYTYRSNSYTRFNKNAADAREIPSQNIVNASLMYDLGQVQFGVFVNNLTDEAIVTDIRERRYVEPGDIVFRGRPRTIGARAHFSF